MNSNSEDKDYERMALEGLRIGLKYYIGRLGKMGAIRVIQEIIYVFQDEEYGGFPAFLESIRDYAAQQGNNAAPDIQRTWRKVFWQLGFILQETLTKGRELH